MGGTMKKNLVALGIIAACFSAAGPAAGSGFQRTCLTGFVEPLERQLLANRFSLGFVESIAAGRLDTVGCLAEVLARFEQLRPVAGAAGPAADRPWCKPLAETWVSAVAGHRMTLSAAETGASNSLASVGCLETIVLEIRATGPAL